MRLAVYSDYSYRRDGEALWAELSVVVFLAALSAHLERVTLVGRLDPRPGRWAYRVPSTVEFAALPHYPSLTRPGAVAGALADSVRRFWRVIEAVDVVWLLGPHPFAVLFALIARARGRKVVLGVRQDLPAYVANRHPRRRWLLLAARLLEGSWRLLGRAFPVVVVGPDLARRYRRAPQLLPISISLVPEDRVAGPSALAQRDYEAGELRVLSVGRLEAEKNPLLLADVLSRLDGDARGWRLLVCGEGPMSEDLRARLRELGVAHRAHLLGFVPLEEGLLDLYRSSHLLLHCSWTEGVPQVLLEAFAARLPAVATAVGGVPDAAGDAALLVPPGDASTAAEGLRRLAADPALRERLTDAGAERARRHSLEAETRRVARFLSADGGR